MRNKIKLAALLLLVVVFCIHSISAMAHTIPDLDKTGSISVSMIHGTEPVGGGNLIIYRVGEIVVDDGNYSFSLTDAFRQSNVLLDDFLTAAASLAEFAADRMLSGDEKQISADGSAVFSDLEPGLYLIVQTIPAQGYYLVTPSLVPLPIYDGEEYIYDIDATPKLELNKDTTIPSDPTGPGDPSDPTEPSAPSNPTDPTDPSDSTDPTDPSTPSDPTAPSDPTDPTDPSEPTEPSTPTNPTEPSKPSDPTQPSDPTIPTNPSTPTEPSSTPTSPTKPTQPGLPQTGQTNWPVPVLAVAGLLLIVLGWFLCASERKEMDAQ